MNTVISINNTFLYPKVEQVCTSPDPLSPREGLASETSDSGSSGDTGEGELVEVAVLRYTMFGPKKQVSDSSYTPAILHDLYTLCVFCM